jgi:hypothetical protein
MIFYDITSHIAGDTWDGLGTITFLRGGSALNLTNASLEMDLRLSFDSPSVLTLSTANSGIIIRTPALSGVVQIPQRIVDVPPGTYKYDLKLTLSSGEVKTYLGGSWPILSHITR